MAKSKLNLRDAQLQARVGLILSVASVVCVLVLGALILENFNPAERTIAYSPKSLRYPAILGLTGLSGFLAVVWFGLGISSLGHKRNARQRESWIGFLLGALVVSLTIILYMLFRMFALAIVR